jgi:hypothetical protein
MDLYIDCEWHISQDIFLIGYGYDQRSVYQAYMGSLSASRVKSIFRNITGYVYFYGPDIGMIEKNYDLDIRNNYKCINLLRMFRQVLPDLDSYKLSEIEKLYGIYRKSPSEKYKKNIRTLFEDWKRPELRKLILRYNKEDVVNLMKLKKIIFRDNGVRKSHLENSLLEGIFEDDYKDDSSWHEWIDGL